MHGQLRLNEFSATDLKKIDANLPISDFTLENFYDFYDACEELLLEQGFELWDDDIEYEGERTHKGMHEFRYNCAVVCCTKRNNKYIVNNIKIAFWHINDNRMNDLEKLVYVANNLATFKDGNGKPQPDSLKAQEYLLAYINKMKDYGVKNIKELLQ